LELDIAVLCELKDSGPMTQGALGHAVPGAADQLLRLAALGYIRLQVSARHSAQWELTYKGMDLVDGDG
jgi:hypothetical protein